MKDRKREQGESNEKESTNLNSATSHPFFVSGATHQEAINSLVAGHEKEKRDKDATIKSLGLECERCKADLEASFQRAETMAHNMQELRAENSE
jgi:hypothetical protein